MPPLIDVARPCFQTKKKNLLKVKHIFVLLQGCDVIVVLLHTFPCYVDVFSFNRWQYVIQFD